MARDGPSPSAKGKAKVRTLPTRALPRLTALRAQASTPSPATISLPAVPALAVARRSARISTRAPEPKLEDAIHKVDEMDEDQEEDPEEEVEQEDFHNLWGLADSTSSSSEGDDLRFWNYDGDLSD
ncbi:hypothetical protein PIB30_052561 [Stylosanthes scabra]|uniref:Uncharacterized protein n=1 Tax=Stylosanthes scabra TaxID=79078 RepID=A0ABU6WJW4_9FABA|nr:hypothetical protein [Stylosanthes scabra]